MNDPTTTRRQGWTWPHLTERALERSVLTLTPDHLTEIKSQIGSGRARYLGDNRRGADVWEVRLGKPDVPGGLQREEGSGADVFAVRGSAGVGGGGETR